MFVKENDTMYSDALQSFYKKYVHVSDEIHLSAEDDLAIQGMWSGGKTSKVGEQYFVPCDLIVTNTVPLPNVRIIVDERGFFEDGTICKFEVLLLPDKVLQLQKALQLDTMYEVGVVKVLNGREIIVPFFVIKGEDSLALGSYAIVDGNLYRASGDAIDIKILKTVVSMLSTWYGIQIALLNPQTKGCFRGSSINPTETKRPKPARPAEKRKTNYVKRVYVKRGEIKKRVENHIKRKTLSWYVVGHWRHYKDGKIIFINGYWKGLLKNTKRNLDGGRIREIS